LAPAGSQGVARPRREKTRTGGRFQIKNVVANGYARPRGCSALAEYAKGQVLDREISMPRG
jgi:hypothetical protein